MRFSKKIFTLFLIIFSSAVFAQSAHSNLKDPKLTKRFKHISEEIMCVCGCGDPLEYCNHMQCIAWGIRDVIDKLLAAGKTDDYIIAGFINGYGNIVDTDASFEIIRTRYREYLQKFRVGFGEKYRSYPAKHNPQIMIIVILFIAAGTVGIFIKKRLKKLKDSDKNKPSGPSGSGSKEDLYKTLYE